MIRLFISQLIALSALLAVLGFSTLKLGTAQAGPIDYDGWNATDLTDQIDFLVGWRHGITAQRIDLAGISANRFPVRVGTTWGSGDIELLEHRIRAAMVLILSSAAARDQVDIGTIFAASWVFDLDEDLLQTGADLIFTEIGLRGSNDSNFIVNQVISVLIDEQMARSSAALRSELETLTMMESEVTQMIARANEALEALRPDAPDDSRFDPLLTLSTFGWTTPADSDHTQYDDVQILGRTDYCGHGLGCCYEYLEAGLPEPNWRRSHAGIEANLCIGCRPGFALYNSYNAQPTCSNPPR